MYLAPKISHCALSCALCSADARRKTSLANCLYSSSRFMLASWLFLVLCHESNIGTLNAFPGTRVKYSGSTTFRGVAVPSTELSPFSFVDCNNKEGIKWPKKFAFEPTE